jgi:chaperone modulatory protein CbpM
MITTEIVLEQITDLAAEELESWIASGWVRPEGEPGRWVFHEIDVARVRLIAEFRHELAIDDGALPVILSLLDQLYAVRRDLGALCRAVAAQPEESRRAIATALRSLGTD